MLLKIQSRKTRHFLTIFSLCVMVLFIFSDSNAAVRDKKYDEISTKKEKRYTKRLAKRNKKAESKPDKPRLQARLGKLNYALRNYEASEKAYDKLFSLSNKKRFDKKKLFYAKATKINGNYKKASKIYNDFIKNHNNKRTGYYVNHAKEDKRGIDYAIKQMKKPSDAILEKIKISQVNQEVYGASYMGDDEMIYTVKDKEENAKLPHTFIATSKKNDTGWNGQEKLNGNINKPNRNTGNTSISPDGKTLYYTECRERLLRSNCFIYRSTLQSNGKWGEGKLLKKLNKKGSSTTHPSVRQDKNGNQILYFASDRKKGFGGFDLYAAPIDKNGNVGEIVNLGKGVNTSQDEITPFYDNNSGDLYFSSTGRIGMGGYDIFKVSGNEQEGWSRVSNLGYPINTSADETYFTLNRSSNEGFLTSNKDKRNGTNVNAIYGVSFPKFVFMNSNFVSSKDNKPIENVRVSIYEKIGDEYKLIDSKIGKDLRFKLEPNKTYKINAIKDGYWPVVKEFTTPNVKTNKSITSTYKMKPVEKEEKKEKKKREYLIKNVFFGFDRADVLPQYKERLDTIYKVLIDNQEYYLRIEGHTDSKGSDQYNISLSERRANNCKNYIVNKGLEADRVMTKGYGESRPISPNKLINGADNPEGRARNRRVDFKVLSDVNEKGDNVIIIYDNNGSPIHQE